MDKSSFTLIGIILVALAVITLVAVLWQALKVRRKYAAWVVTPGKVIEVRFESITPGNPYYFPVVEFIGTAGQSMTFESDVGSYPQKPQVGMRVDVIFNPGDPRETIIRSWSAMWFTLSAIAGMECIALVLGMMILTLSL